MPLGMVTGWKKATSFGPTTVSCLNGWLITHAPATLMDSLVSRNPIHPDDQRKTAFTCPYFVDL